MNNNSSKAESAQTYRMIPMETYKRKAHFDYFRTMAYPYVGVTVDVDVTDLAGCCRQNGISFYLAFMHAAALAADRVPELRQRIHDDGIIEYAQCGTSHTERMEDGTYCYCTLHHHMPLQQYLTMAEETRSQCRTSGTIEQDDAVESLYFISTLPWIHYSQLIQPVAGGDESNPRITWGAYAENTQGRLMMPVSLLCHHALVDGVHLAAFYRMLDEELRQIVDAL